MIDYTEEDRQFFALRFRHHCGALIGGMACDQDQPEGRVLCWYGQRRSQESLVQLRDATTYDPQRDHLSGDHLEVYLPKRDLKMVVVKLRRALAKQASREAREALALLEQHLGD